MDRIAVESKYMDNSVNKPLTIYEGRFVIYTTSNGKNITLRCDGNLHYNINAPGGIEFSAKIHRYTDLKDDIDLIDMELATIEIVGYKLIECQINSIRSDTIRGFVSDVLISSKDCEVDCIYFDILNMDKIPGKLVEYKDIVYAGRIEFPVGEYLVTIDKSYGYNKELHEELVSKLGSIITHHGKITRRDKKKFKTKKIQDILVRISLSVSFLSGRYVCIPNAFGKFEDKEVFRMWQKMPITDYSFVLNWTSTISNYHNLEKYLTLMNKKLNEKYYREVFSNIMPWYVEALNGINIDNNIISIQTALEMISFVVLVESSSELSVEKFNQSSANQNIRRLLKFCSINTDIPQNIFDESIYFSFEDGLDLVTYYRNLIVHPSKSRRYVELGFEDMWYITLLGIHYIEMSILYLINYKGEYTDRFGEIRFGSVKNVPWKKNKK